MFKHVKKLILTAVFTCFFLIGTEAQEPDSSRIGYGFIIGKDTIIHRNIMEVRVYPQHEFNNPRMEKQYSRLIQRVKKVYPYAVKANELLTKYEPEYEQLKTDRERRKLMKHIEDELLAQYKDDLKKMSISDGKVLIKLIDRQTGRTSYTIIKEFRGGFAAVFWQGIARLFKNNLKDEFDPYGEDKLIEEIVTQIELGYL
jgi:Domain of unknown function (DUF4294)